MPRFLRKMILHSSKKVGILKPWNNTPWPRRFKLVFWETSEQIDRKLQYKEKAFEEFQGLSLFLREIVLYSFTKFGIPKPWINFVSFTRFDWGFWQTSTHIYRKLQYWEKALQVFQGLPRSPRKIVLYSSTTFGIIQPFIDSQSLRRFDLVFWQTSKQFYRKLQYTE